MGVTSGPSLSVLLQEELVKKLDLQPKRQTIDPIRSVFDKMKVWIIPMKNLKNFVSKLHGKLMLTLRDRTNEGIESQ